MDEVDQGRGLGQEEELYAPDTEPERGEGRAFRRGLLTGIAATLLAQVGLVLVILVGVGRLIEKGIIPDSAAVPGEKLPRATVDFLRENGIVEEDETVLYYYGSGLLSLREDGNLFTDRRVISYWEDENEELVVEWAAYPDVVDIHVDFAPEGAEDASQVAVEKGDGAFLELFVSNEEGRDHAFVDLLRNTWEKNRGE